MAIVTMNPLFTAAGGRVANILFYTVERTVYALRYVKPRDPKTDAQKKNRALFRQAMQSCKGLSAFSKARNNDPARTASARDFTRPGTINGCFSRFHPQTG
ncbi:MAG TPA: hypothetical protein PK926_14065 [Spirochaetota bacterium]|nr:hypothetical protein [Spirochaetota bacterium]HPI90141.1 hypothetical protein [Spirochaetota bacterium]HPR49143.1 hypothetical protein [Spirochaetota bacterium]